MAPEAITDDRDAPTTSPFDDLTAFQLDILMAIPRAEAHVDHDLPHGLAVKDYLSQRREGEIHHGRLYPNIEQLVDAGYVERVDIDDRTKGLRVTDAGQERVFALLADAHDAADAFGAVDA